MRQGKLRIGAVVSVLLITASFGVIGCAPTRPGNAVVGALTGAAAGAGLGAIAGAPSGNAAKGAGVGAIAGAIIGGLIGANQPVVQQPAPAYNYQYQPWQEGNVWCCRDQGGRQMWYYGQQWSYTPLSSSGQY